MREAEGSVRRVAEELLRNKKVDLIIGYERGTLPLRTTPCFIKDPAEVDRFVWDVTCGANLSKYLLGREGRVGIVAKGCDARSIVVLSIEGQIDRDNIVIIGVPCPGVVDLKKVEVELDGKEIIKAEVTDTQILVEGEGFSQTLEVRNVLCDSCLVCRHRNPPIYDFLVGEKLHETPERDEYVETLKIEEKSDQERWEYFSKEFENCIRCYACREACPLCYCHECFVDQIFPSWFGKTSDLPDIMVYHIVRTLHVAGRCVDCGACSRACPMNINLRVLMKKTEKIMKERFNYEVGLDLKEAPPLGTFTQEDPEEFIL